MRRYYSITELTKEFDISTRTLRFYESEGLIAPLRRERQRLYSPADRTRIRLILRGRRLGFSLAEIRDIVEMYDTPPGEVRQLQYLVDKINEKRSDLLSKRDDIDLTLDELDCVEAGCRARLAAMATASQ